MSRIDESPVDVARIIEASPKEAKQRADGEERLGQFQPQRGSMPAPLPVLGHAAEAGADRIQMDVPARLEQVLLGLDDSVREAVLNEVAGSTVDAIRPAREFAVEDLHPVRETTLGRMQDEVVVIRHLAVGVDDPP